MASGEYRLRCAYTKAGRLRWLSHLEVTRALERGFRRASLPYAVTQGYSPRMRVAFGPALPVGTAGDREFVDLWLTDYVPASDVVTRLEGALPDGLGPLAASYVAAGVPSLTAGVLIGEYDVVVQGEEVSRERTQAALDALMAFGELTVEHKGKTKVFDLARSLPKEPLVSEADGQVHVHLTVRMGPEGSLRPDVLLLTAFERLGRAGVVTAVTRTDTFAENEEGVWSRPL